MWNGLDIQAASINGKKTKIWMVKTEIEFSRSKNNEQSMF